MDRSSNRSLASQVLQNLRRGQNTKVSLPTTNLVVGSFSSNYVVQSKGFDQYGRMIFEQEEYLNADSHTESIFVQTDKGMYKPGSKVKYRIVVVTPEMKPLRGTVSLKIKDQKRNIITQLLNQPLNKGVLSKELQLSDEPPLGDWTIEVETSSGNKMIKGFTVEKYVLPKFEVTVENANGESSLLTDSITANVKAKYTFGQGVPGTVDVTAGPPYWMNHFPGPMPVDGPMRFVGSPMRPQDQRRALIKRARLDQNGAASVVFSNAELRNANLINDYGGSLNLSAAVTEQLTSEQRGGFTMVQLVKDPVRFKFEKPSVRFVPGMDYTFTVSLESYDGTPLPVNYPRRVTLNMTHNYKYSPPPPPPVPVDNSRIGRGQVFSIPFQPYEPRRTNDVRTVTLDGNGKASVTIRPPVNVSNVQIQAEYDYAPDRPDMTVQGWESISSAESPSDNYLSITALTKSVVPGQQALFMVSSTEPIGSVTILVVAKGKIAAMVDNYPVRGTSGQVAVTTTSEMAPRARVVVYKMRLENKEIIADSVELKLEQGSTNRVQISMNPSKARPGDPVTVRVRSNPNSFVGLMAVDKSVKLLKSGNDITQEMIDQEMDQYNYPGYNYGPMPFRRRKRSIMPPWFGGGMTAKSVFDSANVAVLTDAWLYGSMPFYPRGGFGGIMPEIDAAGPMPMAPLPAPPPNAAITTSGQVGGFGAGGPPARTRSVFPETWIWFDSVSQVNGDTVLQTTAPDTITTWLTSAFAIDDSMGLGVSPEPVQFEVFQPFFVRANLPYSVKRGEQLGLQVLVFNYQPTPQQVTVTLTHDATSGFDFVAQNGAPIKAGRGSPGYNVRTVTVGGTNGKSTADVFFPIVPTTIGNVPLKIQASGAGVADRLEKDLRVEPEGFMVEINKPVTIDLSSNPSFRDSVSVPIPQDIVPDSERAEVSVTGTVMGPAVQNVKSLVRMPYGCGEQNMVGFVPNIVVLRYLAATQQLQPPIRAEAIRNMEAGYQRELNYKRDDGSYSAFGESDPAGSTWLTAFVMKSFAQAKGSIFIDDEVMKQGLQFLKEKQKSDGGFREDGDVHSSHLQGGASSGLPLAAFVLISMLQNQEANPRAQSLLERSLNSISNDPYALTIITYALHMANSPMKEQAMQLMERAATQQNGNKYWKDRADEAEYEQDRPPYWSQPPSTDVESTGYALLTYILRNDMNNALPVVRWLTQKRNPYGGFTSTQDTVIALQGLGAFAERAYSNGLNANVQVSSGRDSRSFQVNPANAIVQQKAKISNARQPVSFQATGTGMVTAQLTVRYNSKMRKQNDPFECSPTVTPKSLNDITISMCCRHKKLGKTKMAVMEVNALSGYNIDEEKLQSLTSIQDLQRVELEKGNSKANIYFNSLGPRPTCFNVSSSKSFDVASQKPARMSLYAYYAPEKRIEMEYSATSSQPLYQSCPRCWENARIRQWNQGRWNQPQRQTQRTNQRWWYRPQRNQRRWNRRRW